VALLHRRQQSQSREKHQPQQIHPVHRGALGFAHSASIIIASSIQYAIVQCAIILLRGATSLQKTSPEEVDLLPALPS
jgi:hypothetical protein